MNVDVNKETVHRLHQLVNGGDAKSAAELFAPVSNNHGCPIERRTMLLILESLVALEIRYDFHEVIAEGDWVACRMTVSGKHSIQPLFKILDGGIYSVTKPTGQPFSVQQMHFFKVVNGQIFEHWANRDDLGAARQLGLELRPTTP